MKKLVLLTYNLKPGSDLEEYKKFTREIDYPTFRQNPHVLDYSNYVITRNYRGEEWFKHLDLMLVDDFEVFEDEIRYGDHRIAEHADRWIRTWSVHGPEVDDMAKNVRISFAEEI